MERVTGIAGFSSEREIPAGCSAGTQDVLGVEAVPRSYDETGWNQQEGETVFGQRRLAPSPSGGVGCLMAGEGSGNGCFGSFREVRGCLGSFREVRVELPLVSSEKATRSCRGCLSPG